MSTNRLHMIVRKDKNGLLYAHNREDGSLDLYLRFGSAFNKRNKLSEKDKESEYEVVALEVEQKFFNE